MKTCIKCNIQILDDTDRCPLCKHALSTGEGGIVSYPNAEQKFKAARFLERLFLFLSVIALVASGTLNYLFYDGFLWCLLVLFGLILANTTLRYAVLGRSSYLGKTFVMTVLVIGVIIGVDFVTGFRGWSLGYATPGVIIMVDLAILILMLVNRRNWQSYMMPQIVMILVSLIPWFATLFFIRPSCLVSGIALAFSVFCFLGTVIFGDKRARVELQRRFHLK